MKTSLRGRTDIRWFVRRDLPELLAIEAASHPNPWTADDFLNFLRRRACIGMAAEVGGSVVGFMVYEIARDDLWLANLAVHPAYRRQGVGRLLLDKLLYKCQSHQRGRVMTAVGEENLAAQLFLRAGGWVATRVLPEYPRGPAIRFEGRPVSALDGGLTRRRT